MVSAVNQSSKESGQSGRERKPVGQCDARVGGRAYGRLATESEAGRAGARHSTSAYKRMDKTFPAIILICFFSQSAGGSRRQSPETGPVSLTDTNCSLRASYGTHARSWRLVRFGERVRNVQGWTWVWIPWGWVLSDEWCGCGNQTSLMLVSRRVLLVYVVR